MEKSSSERVLVVESDDALRTSIVGAFSDARYDVSTDYRERMKSAPRFSPDAAVLGANPPQLDSENSRSPETELDPSRRPRYQCNLCTPMLKDTSRFAYS
jgi:hypothetical protein